MTWLKLDDGFPAHPKIVKLSHRAFRLHVSALCYCAANLTDGLVEREALRTIGAYSGRSKTLTDELETARLWVPIPPGWTIHGYLELNPSKHEVEVRRTVAKANAEKRWGRHPKDADGNANGIADGNAIPNALPSHPIHSQKSVSSSSSEARHEQGTISEIGGSTFDRIIQICRAADDPDARDKLERTRKTNRIPESRLVEILWAINQKDTRYPTRKALSMMTKEAA